jgi:UDP-N-acetylmuramyl tripeptide synthase
MTSSGAITVSDSRRLTGPSLVLDRPGAVLEIHLDDPAVERGVGLWREAARGLLAAVGWAGESLAVRRFAGGASLALSAPIDALYAAVELNEAAWTEAAAVLAGHLPPARDPVAERLRREIAAERRPELVAMRDAARTHDVTFLTGEDQVSVGSGTGVRVWPAEGVPAPSQVDWAGVHDVPVALVTGSNGKTTVVRLLAAMLGATGRTAGFTSTDGVHLGGATLDAGDYSGPSGARLLLRHAQLEVAVLETARGGVLRRGLPVDHAEVAVVTNIADDHLGEYGVQDMEALADVKLLIARPVRDSGAVVLNADDPLLRARGAKLTKSVVWFTLEPARPEVARHLAAGGRAAMLVDGSLVLAEGMMGTTVAGVTDVPLTLGGAARHNVANALAAIGAAAVLGVPTEAMRRALGEFGRDAGDNAGRANVVELGGIRVIVDYAHNPHGMAALAEMAAAMPAGRRLVMIGQAGDRSDQAIRELARSALAIRPDRVVLKEMERYLRGRQPGEIPGLMADELARHGVPPEAIRLPGTELDAVRDALEWARPGDVLLLAVHQDRPLVMALLEHLRDSGWRPETPLPVEEARPG